MTIDDYWDQSRAINAWHPNPFHDHADGPWHGRTFPSVVGGIACLLGRFRARDVTENHLLRGKDNGPAKRDTLSYWLYYQHHPGSAKWKLMGQRYWSVEAWRSWRDAGGRRFPKRGRFGDRGLVSEHVVPKLLLKDRLIACEPSDHAAIQRLLEKNLCCVVTRAEDKKLERDTHPDIDDPWLRYANKNINLLHNPDWTRIEIEPLLRHGLIGMVSIEPTTDEKESRPRELNQ